MELVLLIAMTLVMSGAAIVMALREQPLPSSASTAFVAAGLSAAAVRKSPPGKSAARNAATDETTELNAGMAQPESQAAEEYNDMDSTFSHTDVLLADALTEMVGLKAELYHLRKKVDSLNSEVVRLSGGSRPTPPAASKQPVPLRKVA